jgi:hypothetical protein
VEREQQPPSLSATRELVEAVFDLFDDPCAANVERYLAASQAVEDSRGCPPSTRGEPVQSSSA